MKKLISIIGGIICIIAVLLGLLDPTLGFWELKIEEIFGDGWEGSYLNAFGQYVLINGDVETIDENIIMIIISLSILIGGVLIVTGGFMDKGPICVIGSLLIVGGISYFLYTLPKIEMIDNYFDLLNLSGNKFFGSDTVVLEHKWRLGNGFFVLFFGTIIALIGTFLKDD